MLQGLDLHNTNNQGHNALHKAAYGGHKAVCEWLQEGPVGLDVQSQLCDVRGQTPCDLAKKAGFEELALWLQRHTVCTK
jgi:ankyrin repeat protein